MQLLAVSFHERRLYLIFENFSQQSLQKTLQSSPSLLGAEDRFCILKQVVIAILYLHMHFGKPIFHRCLSPLNVFLDEGAHVKLAHVGQKLNCANLEVRDFVQKDAYVTFVAPEVFSNRISVFSDIFSLGRLMLALYDQAGGEEAFADVEEYCKWVRAGGGIDAGSSGGEMPPELRTLALRCLEYNPYKRPHILEIAETLDTLS